MKKIFFVLVLFATTACAQVLIDLAGTSRDTWQIGKSGARIKYNRDSLTYKFIWRKSIGGLDSGNVVLTNNPRGNSIYQDIIGRKWFKAPTIIDSLKTKHISLSSGLKITIKDATEFLNIASSPNFKFSALKGIGNNILVDAPTDENASNVWAKYYAKANQSGVGLTGYKAIIQATEYITASTNYGFYADVQSYNSGGGTAYGIYAKATGGGVNYSAYFDDGQVYVKDNLSIAQRKFEVDLNGNITKWGGRSVDSTTRRHNYTFAWDSVNAKYKWIKATSGTYTETDPTINAWAKAATKPSYVWTEIGSKPTSFTADVSLQYNWTNYQQWSLASTTNATLGSFILSGNQSGSTLKGISSVVTYSGAPTAQNVYGGYFSATGYASGGSVSYGIYATATGADVNYAGYFVGNVYSTGTYSGTFSGNLTGNVTGTVSGNAGTVTNGVYTNANNTLTGNNGHNGTETYRGVIANTGTLEKTFASEASDSTYSIAGYNTFIIFNNDVQDQAPHNVTFSGMIDGQMLFVSNDKDSVADVYFDNVINKDDTDSTPVLILSKGESAILRYRYSESRWYATGF